jgi:hypothetical protein
MRRSFEFTIPLPGEAAICAATASGMLRRNVWNEPFSNYSELSALNT